MKHLSYVLIASFLFISCVHKISRKYYPDGRLQEEYSTYNKHFDGGYKAYATSGILTCSGQFENGRKVGEWQYYYNNGKIQSIQLFDSKAKLVALNAWNEQGKQTIKNGTGIAMTYYSSNQIKTRASYKNNVLDGTFTTWYKNGQKEMELQYKNGKQLFSKYWDENGNTIRDNN